MSGPLSEVILIAYPLTQADRDLITSHDFDQDQSEPRDVPQKLAWLDNKYAGGSKTASWDVFQGCFNTVDADSIVTWFDDLPLQDRSMVLIVDREDHPPIIRWVEDGGDELGQWDKPYVAPQQVAIQAAYTGVVLFQNGSMMDIAQIERLLTDNGLLPAAGVQDLGDINQPVHAEYQHEPEETGVVTVCGRTDGRSWTNQLLEEVNCPDCLEKIQQIAPQLMQPPPAIDSGYLDSLAAEPRPFA